MIVTMEFNSNFILGKKTIYSLLPLSKFTLVWKINKKRWRGCRFCDVIFSCNPVHRNTIALQKYTNAHFELLFQVFLWWQNFQQKRGFFIVPLMISCRHKISKNVYFSIGTITSRLRFFEILSIPSMPRTKNFVCVCWSLFP